MNHCVVIWMNKETPTPSVIGPFDSVDAATEFGNKLLDDGCYLVKLSQITHPRELFK